MADGTDGGLNIQELEVLFDKAQRLGRNMLMEHEAYEILRTAGLNVPRYRFAKSRFELEKLIPSVLQFGGEKVVLKVVSPQIMHKLDVGGVSITAKDRHSISQAFDAMVASVKRNDPKADISGIMLIEFVPIEYEILISLLNDGQFGTFLSVGLGGTYTEIFRDIRLVLTPASREYILQELKSLKSFPIFQGYRGLNSVPEESILGVLEKMSLLGTLFSPWGQGRYVIEEFEVNPFAVTPSGEIVAVDSILRFSSRRDRVSLPAPNTESLENFFRARSIAVVGATEGAGKIGGAIMRNITKSASSSVFPVNPNRTHVLGLKAYPSVTDIPYDVDLAVVAVPAPLCPEVIRQCSDKGIRSVVLVTGGFSEYGEQGAALEEEIRDIVKKTGLRIVGPNCIGVYSEETGLNTFFLPEDRMRIGNTKNNSLVILSQSGGIAINLTTGLERVGVRAIVSYGNMLDADAADFIAYFNEDVHTKAVLVYAEGFGGRGRKFFQSASRADKPVIVLKGGKSPAGAKAAQSHTGSMAGDYTRVQAVFRQAGIIEALSLQEAMDYAKVFCFLGANKFTSKKICIISNAGGLCILGADELRNTGLELGSFGMDTKAGLEAAMEGYVRPNNPLDLGGGVSDTGFTAAVDLVLKDPEIDAVCLLPAIEPSPIDPQRLFSSLIRAVRAAGKPAVTAFASSTLQSEMAAQLEDQGIPVYPTPERAVRALGVYMNFCEEKYTHRSC